MLSRAAGQLSVRLDDYINMKHIMIKNLPQDEILEKNNQK